MKQKAPSHLSVSLPLHGSCTHTHSPPCTPFSSHCWAAPLWGQTLPSGYGHPSTLSWKESAGFPRNFRKHYFGPHRKKLVGKWVLLGFYLRLGFHFCCSNPQAGNRGLGHCDIFSLQGCQKRWMLPSGDTLLHLILERKKFVISLETCAKEFSWFWPCKLPFALVNQKFIFHINPVPWLYALSRHCTVCLRWDWFSIEGISLKSKPHGN